MHKEATLQPGDIVQVKLQCKMWDDESRHVGVEGHSLLTFIEKRTDAISGEDDVMYFLSDESSILHRRWEFCHAYFRKIT